MTEVVPPTTDHVVDVLDSVLQRQAREPMRGARSWSSRGATATRARPGPSRPTRGRSPPARNSRRGRRRVGPRRATDLSSRRVSSAYPTEAAVARMLAGRPRRAGQQALAEVRPGRGWACLCHERDRAAGVTAAIALTSRPVRGRRLQRRLRNRPIRPPRQASRAIAFPVSDRPARQPGTIASECDAGGRRLLPDQETEVGSSMTLGACNVPSIAIFSKRSAAVAIVAKLKHRRWRVDHQKRQSGRLRRLRLR